MRHHGASLHTLHSIAASMITEGTGCPRCVLIVWDGSDGMASARRMFCCACSEVMLLRSSKADSSSFLNWFVIESFLIFSSLEARSRRVGSALHVACRHEFWRADDRLFSMARR
ncbi:hypothetical protein AF72_12195 [Xylella taiwanensis]|uniref:Uncharacterized protein n=1 Tax=Xylella taiwanensis TaxID=1444770 RepID=Z9JGN1_9GAMM|nr:hypothetical protein AB672_03975 [Xylella taiwanensis]EWS77178.1 hypothetical protein AF72_12195 [Xylella taiwanensis]